jgi:hypothetical protein
VSLYHIADASTQAGGLHIRAHALAFARGCAARPGTQSTMRRERAGQTTPTNMHYVLQKLRREARRKCTKIIPNSAHDRKSAFGRHKIEKVRVCQHKIERVANAARNG